MQMDNVEPDQVTVTVALSACADIGALEKAEWIHAYVRRKQGLNMDLCLKNALINMYAKCGDIITARRLFDSIRTKDVTTWTSMIVGHALHGQAEEALKIFYEMKDLKQNPGVNKGNNISSSSPVLPNDVTFVGVQMACSHAG
ncbi:Pentatricopeptide repeat [Quillaja saponaria]|uniref:Pentatricopeptide repeat n=1 Tax=Quillaja saponaria TaxID=32244 RepID=A0AAD7KMQ5_QUISA|nr:Pentatricopeptide repeat [Quillaja saponaria]